MAYVGRQTTTTWLNNDGQYIKFGTDEAAATNVGEYRTLGARRSVECIIDCSNLPTQASGNIQIQSDTVDIPIGAFIEEVRLTVIKETTAGGGAALNVGLVNTDRATVISDTAFVAANTTVADGTDLGEVVTLTKGSAGAGALIGTKITTAGLITAFPTVASFTAGTVKCEIFYSMPLSTDL